MPFVNLAANAVVIVLAAIGAVGCADTAPGATPTSSRAPTPELTLAPEPTISAPLTSAPSATGAAPSPDSLGPLTQDELTALTLGTRAPIPADAPKPVITADQAEQIIRAKFVGDRQTYSVERIAMNLLGKVIVGWYVGLTPDPAVGCSVNPGLLGRPIEGGMVDDQTGEIGIQSFCPENPLISM